MTFDHFVEALDRGLRSAAPANYGFYRGPNVVYWHIGDRTARLRAGQSDDALLDGNCEAVHAKCDAEAVGRMVAALSTLSEAVGPPVSI